MLSFLKTVLSNMSFGTRKEKEKMKNKWKLIASIFQIVVGLAAIFAFIVLGFAGQSMLKWIGTLFLAIGFVFLGVFGILEYRANK